MTSKVFHFFVVTTFLVFKTGADSRLFLLLVALQANTPLSLVCDALIMIDYPLI